jgi:hypothetical protein
VAAFPGRHRWQVFFFGPESIQLGTTKSTVYLQPVPRYLDSAHKGALLYALNLGWVLRSFRWLPQPLSGLDFSMGSLSALSIVTREFAGGSVVAGSCAFKRVC